MTTQTILPGFPFSVFVCQSSTTQTVLPNSSMANLAPGGTYTAPTITPAVQPTWTSLQVIAPGPLGTFLNFAANTWQLIAPSGGFIDLGTSSFTTSRPTAATQADPSPYSQGIAPGFPFSVFVNQTSTQQTVLPNGSFVDLVVVMVTTAFHRMLLFFR